MKMLKNKNRSKSILLIFIAWLVYTVSYFGKVNYSANITNIIEFYSVTRAEAGIAPTFFFFAYGFGQVFNGIMCKKYNIKWVIFFSLITSSVINGIIAVSSNFDIIKWLWLVNGFVLSVLWPSIVRLLTESLPQRHLVTSSIVMGTTVAVGTISIYGLSAIYSLFEKFKLSFFTASFSVAATAFFWLIIFKKAVKDAESEKGAKEAAEVEEDAEKSNGTARASQERNVCSSEKIFISTLYSLCFFAIIVNLIKDGLATWVPSILKETFFMSDALSILLTSVLLVMAVFGNVFALKVHKKIPDYVNHCAVMTATISLFVVFVIFGIFDESILLMLLGLIAVSFIASSLNSLVTTIYPLFIRQRGNSGMYAGIINGFCYLGSTISSYGLGIIADNYDWQYVFYTLLLACLLGLIVCLVYNVYKHRIQ